MQRVHCNTTILTALLLAVGSTAFAQSQERGATQVPAPVRIVEARPYEVEQAMSFRVDGEDEDCSEGYVLVVEADLRLLQPDNAADYVLYAGSAVAQRVNTGYRDGRLIVITASFDPKVDCLWLGPRGLPDRMGPADFQREKDRATAAGIEPFPEKHWKRALERGKARGDGPLLAKHLNHLWYQTVDLILEYAPAERRMARSLRPGRLDD